MFRAKVCFKFHPHKDYLKYGQKITPSTQNLNSMNHLLFSTLQPPKLLLIPSGNQRGLLENPPFGFRMILPAINLYIYGIFMDFPVSPLRFSSPEGNRSAASAAPGVGTPRTDPLAAPRTGGHWLETPWTSARGFTMAGVSTGRVPMVIQWWFNGI